jgi:PAS domain S-box-containing protein
LPLEREGGVLLASLPDTTQEAPRGKPLADDLSQRPDRGLRFPFASGEMADLVRDHDWSAGPMGDIAGWGPGLRTAVTLMLSALQPMFIVWGPQRTFLYNDAYARILAARHPAALGRFMGEVWPEIYDDARAFIDPAFEGRAAWAENVRRVIIRDGRPEEGWYTLSYTPIHDEAGAVGGVFCAVTDSTPHVLAQQRLAFLLHLSERLRASGDPVEITGIAARELGLHLGLARVGHAEVDEAQQAATIHRDWARPGLKSLAGTVSILDSFGPEIIAELKAGRIVHLDDVAADPRSAGHASAYAELGIRALLAAPLIRDGRFVAVLFLHDSRPRAWTAGDEGLAEDVAARTWSAMTRARAEAALQESESRFRAMADQAPAPIWVTSAAGGIEFVNQAFAEYAGSATPELLGDVWLRLLHPDDLAGVAAARASARLTNAAYSFEARFRRADGDWRQMLASARPRVTQDGVFQGYVGLAIDLTEMRAAEAALRESEARFRLVAESAPVMLWMGDEAGHCVYLNGALREFWGVPEDLAGFTWDQTLLADDQQALFAAFGVAMERQEAFEVEARYYRADGEVRTVFTRAKPRHDAKGRFVGMIGVNVDVTEARRAQAHQQLLINELNHRVKNTLATVQSIAHQTLRDGAVTRDARDLLTSRLLALSAAHDVLTRESWEGADLTEVAAAALRPYETARFTLDGPACRVGPRAALAISMALHELATNAAKYGALSAPGGQVSLSWTPDGGSGLTLVWRERGGPPVASPSRLGFGSRLLRQGLNAELGGSAELTFEPEGVVCVIRASGAE